MKDIFTIRKIALYSLYSSISLMLLGVIIATNKNTVIAGILFIIGIFLSSTFIILCLMYWKCPFCHKSFELKCGKIDKIKICPFCGKKLRE